MQITKIYIPIIPLIIWLEVNVYGETLMPEAFCVGYIALHLYFYWRFKSLWKSMLETKVNGTSKESI